MSKDGKGVFNKSHAGYFQISECDNKTMMKLTGDPFLQAFQKRDEQRQKVIAKLNKLDFLKGETQKDRISCDLRNFASTFREDPIQYAHMMNTQKRHFNVTKS